MEEDMAAIRLGWATNTRAYALDFHERMQRLQAFSLPSATPRPFFTRKFTIGLLLCVAASMLYRALRVYPTGVFDFYPLYYGGQAWLHTGTAYRLDTIIPPDQRNFQLFQIGNVYPLPAVLITLPFSLLPAQLAGTLWVGLLIAGVLLALRLHGWPYWYLLYLPLLEGLRIEQYTVFIVIFQIVALWAWREQRLWLLAICGAIISTKPNHALLFIIILTVITHNWRRQSIVLAALWGGAFVLDPHWVGAWLPLLANSHQVLHQPFLWPLALFALPFVLLGDAVGAAVALQFVMLPFPGSYAAAAVPLSVLGDPRSRWVILAGLLWPIAALTIGVPWATALTILLPSTGLAAVRRWEEHRCRQQANVPTFDLLARAHN